MFDLASMQARKWNSNDRSILSHLDESQTEKEEIVKIGNVLEYNHRYIPIWLHH
jgi:hypothetical protein